MSFVHLHVHSEYSLLDGECRITELPKYAAAHNQSSIALTDHGVLYGAVDFYNECIKNNVKPIIGCEVYVAPRSRFDKQHGLDSEPFHLILLVKNEIGYKNLCKLVSLSYIEGFYSRPRIDLALLEKYNEGLIALSACIYGVVARHLLNRDLREARRSAKIYKDIFGEDFFIEIQRHSIEREDIINPSLIEIAKELEIELVATNDVHYIEKNNAQLQNLLSCVSTNTKIDESDNEAFPTEEFYLKSSDEMKALFYDIPEAISNSVKIAERCKFDFDFTAMHLPKYKINNKESAVDYLRKICYKGLREKESSNNLNYSYDEYVKRLDHELETIERMGFTEYYLIVWDFVQYAKKNDIPVGPGRGSVVGSAAAYFMGVTEIDPLKHRLLFERFLNPERINMPDFDIDFCYDRRGEVIDYVVERYGADHVAQIITFGTMACRAAVRDVGRTLGMSYAAVDEVLSMFPRDLSMSVDSALSNNTALLERYKNDDLIKRLLDYSRQLEGRPRHISTHAAGVVITDKPIMEHVPLAKSGDIVVTQYSMNNVEKLGLLKIDFLGLRYLTIIHNASKLIQKRQPNFSIYDIMLDDEKTFDLIELGKTEGIFQLESDGMRALLTKLKPRTIEDIIIAISLYRPGPMSSIPTFLENRNNPDKIFYKSELLRDILEPTSGCIIYQEQVMEICRVLANYSYGHADIVRRAMAKKQKDVMDDDRKAFILGAEENGVSNEVAESVFDEICEFAKYAFNKSHASGYALVSYRTAYLKTNYPAEYMCALISSVMGDGGKVYGYIEDCKSMGIKVLPPDINKSSSNFGVSKGEIRFGLLAIKNVGINFIEKLLYEREKNGLFQSIEDFLQRMGKDSNTRMLESLIKSGALDSFGVPRSQLVYAVEPALVKLSESFRKNIPGQISLFGAEAVETKLEIKFPPMEEYSLLEKLRMEKELTGIYISGHPADNCRGKDIPTLLEVKQSFENSNSSQKKLVTVVGAVIKNRLKTTKKDELMSFCELEDGSSDAELIIFPKVLNRFSNLLYKDNIIKVVGEASLVDKYDETGEVLKIVVREIFPAQPVDKSTSSNRYDELDAENKNSSPPDLYIKLKSKYDSKLEKTLQLAKGFKGKSRVCVYFEDEKRLVALKNIKCTTDKNTLDAFEKIVGEGNIVLKTKESWNEIL